MRIEQKYVKCIRNFWERRAEEARSHGFIHPRGNVSEHTRTILPLEMLVTLNRPRSPSATRTRTTSAPASSRPRRSTACCAPPTATRWSRATRSERSEWDAVSDVTRTPSSVNAICSSRSGSAIPNLYDTLPNTDSDPCHCHCPFWCCSLTCFTFKWLERIEYRSYKNSFLLSIHTEKWNVILCHLTHLNVSRKNFFMLVL